MASYCVHCTKRNTVNHAGLCSACFSDSIIYYCKCDNDVLVFGKNERCRGCLEERPHEITFVTCIKLMGSYVDFDEHLRVYLDSLCQCPVPYEVLVVEDQDHRNVKFLKDCLSEEYLQSRNARVLEYKAAYPNPHGYNMIEAYSKNAGLKEAKYEFVCITNCDVFFKADFFEWLPQVRPAVFYRFFMYENDVCVNPKLGTGGTLETIAYKSGDIMLMDKASWLNVGGFPESEIWVHSDAIVCMVANNRKMPLMVPPVRVHTAAHARDLPSISLTVDEIVAPYLHRTKTNI